MLAVAFNGPAAAEEDPLAVNSRVDTSAIVEQLRPKLADVQARDRRYVGGAK